MKATTATLPALLLALLLPGVSFAQGSSQVAAELFYRAFWLETAAGKTDQALMLYETIVSDHARAPEAPRAAVGRARILSARGQDVAAIVKWLEKEHPKAKTELEIVRRIAAARLQPFSSTIATTDSPAMAKIKSLYLELGTVGCTPNDLDYLIEAGPLAHPMLAATLRSPHYDPVLRGAGILVAQRTTKAYAVLEAALSDARVLFKTAIVHSLRNVEIESAAVATALSNLYAPASPSMKKSIVSTMTRLAAGEGETRRIAFALLTRALGDREKNVRRAALEPRINMDLWPDAYIAARLDRLEKSDPVLTTTNYFELLRLAHRNGVYDRALKILSRRRLSTSSRYYGKFGSDGARLLAEVVIARRRLAPRSREVHYAARSAASAGPEAAVLLLDYALDAGDTEVAAWALMGSGKKGPAVREYLGKESDRLVRKALAACYGADEKKRDTGVSVAAAVGLGPQGDKLMLHAIQSNPKKALPVFAFDQVHLRAYGPVRMAKVAQFARTEKEANSFLRAGQIYANTAKYGSSGQAFFKVVVPKVGPDVTSYLYNVIKVSPECRAIVATKLLRSPGWDWKSTSGVRAVWSVSKMAVPCATPKLLPVTLQLTADVRDVVAETALIVASWQTAQSGLDALVRGLGAPTLRNRKRAQSYLAAREAGLDALIKHLKWETIGAEERDHAISLLTLSKQPGHVAFIRSRLDTRKEIWSRAWYVYRVQDRKAAVELALAETLGSGPSAYRRAALAVLTRSRDARRIALFAKILKDGDEVGIRTVMQTVSNQYLIELGPEVLEQLRHPDATIRNLATQAIERLKFYADAKKIFKRREMPGK